MLDHFVTCVILDIKINKQLEEEMRRCLKYRQLEVGGRCVTICVQRGGCGRKGDRPLIRRSVGRSLDPDV